MNHGDTIPSTGTLRPDIDDAFWTIVTGDDQWVRAEFDELIAAGWDTPAPPPPPAPPEPQAPQPHPEQPLGARLWTSHPGQPRLCRHHQRSPPMMKR